MLLGLSPVRDGLLRLAASSLRGSDISYRAWRIQFPLTRQVDGPLPMV